MCYKKAGNNLAEAIADFFLQISETLTMAGATCAIKDINTDATVAIKNVTKETADQNLSLLLMGSRRTEVFHAFNFFKKSTSQALTICRNQKCKN